MRNRFLSAITGLALSGSVALAPSLAAADDDGLSDAQRQEVMDLVRETLLTNPTILREAIEALRAYETTQAEQRKQAVIAQLGDMLKHPEGVPVLGNPDGDVTIVEFSDYRCGYCKRVFPIVQDVVAQDGNIRLIVHEYPILGEQSVLAARAAIAAIPQGIEPYHALHAALMAHRGEFTEDIVLNIAKDQGLDVDALKAAMTDPSVDQAIARSFRLAQALEVSGTPAFVVGNRFVPGALDGNTLMSLVQEARANNDG